MKIVLAYSGGLDTSVLLSWIKEKYNERQRRNTTRPSQSRYWRGTGEAAEDAVEGAGGKP